MEYKELIKIVEDKRLNIFRKYKNAIFFKKFYKYYLNKYDELLLELYTYYEK